MDASAVAPESTAALVALWRALHVELDAPPHVFEDAFGLKLLAPDAGWRQRREMDPHPTRTFRASVVARARFTEDLLSEEAEGGLSQYVLLGAGLDTFMQRRPELARKLRVFELDLPGPQAWKRQRLEDLGFGVPRNLKLVPVDFESGDIWWESLARAGFDPKEPALVAGIGLSMYLTRDAVRATLRQVATFMKRSTLVMSFMLPLEHLRPEVRPSMEFAINGAKASGTPFISLFAPQEILELAREAGFREARPVTADELADRYFKGRPDGLRPSPGEELLLAKS